MSFITKRRLASLATGSALIATLAVAAMPMAALAAKPSGPPSTPTSSYLNGFEKATDVTIAADGTTPGTEWVSNVTRLAGTKNGIKAASGAWHASAAKDAYVFTRLGGYSGTFPTDGFTTSVDIYLDMSQNKSVGTDLRFDWDSAISNASGGYGRDFVFNVGTNPAVAGRFLVSASNNADWAPGTVFPADALTITESGWYTFKHTFKNVGGQLTVDMSVVNAGGTVLKTWTLNPAEDIVGQTIGGNRYAWLATNDFTTLALDNVTRVTN